MCGCHRILWLFVHAADEVISSHGLFALLSEARSFQAVDFGCGAGQCFGELLNALDGSRCHSGHIVERVKVAEVCDIGVLLFSETHARVCACRESLVLPSCSRAPTSCSLSQCHPVLVVSEDAGTLGS